MESRNDLLVGSGSNKRGIDEELDKKLKIMSSNRNSHSNTSYNNSPSE